MMNFNEGVAMRYGIKEAVIAQHLWELGENIDNADAALKDSRLWVRASASAIKCALPYFSKHQIKDAIMHLRKEHTKLARAMITRYGMSEDFDMVAMETVTNQYLGGDTSLACSAETQSKIDVQVVELVRKQHEKALTILKDNRDKLDELASYLYEHETITGEEFMRIMNENAST